MLRSFAVSALLMCGFTSGRAADAPSYLNEVVPVLTKAGCNQGACHGKGQGQNGFKLSLRGYDPDSDYKALVREFDGRRIDTTNPANSILFTKPTGKAAHEGGKLFAVESRESETLLKWIAAGAPGPDTKGPKITKLEVTPADRVLKVDEEIQLTAIATFTDGNKVDVTWLTKFDSNDVNVAAVDAMGLVKAKRNGATAIRAAMLTEVAVATLAVPFEKPINETKFAARNNAIDDAVLGKLRALRIEPSELANDAEFLRRVYLDATGSLPPAEVVRKFLADSAADKRAKLIDTLLNCPEFVDYWTLFLSDLLQNRKERDHDVRGVKGVRQFHAWLRGQVAANRPWDELACEILLAKGNTTDSPQIGYYIVTLGEHRETEKSELAESVAQAFLGTRIGCARCHNHPLERYTQDDFYHFSAFFTRVKLDRKDSRQGDTKLEVRHHDDNQNKQPVAVRQPRTNQMLKPQTLDRAAAAMEPSDDPRVKLAAWITDPKNESFSGAMVNRIWRHFLGNGLIEPVDDIRATNPPTNPVLWSALNKEFVAGKFDIKKLIRFILNSRTYQLASATTPANETDAKFFSHYYARRLPAEVLLDALSTATGTHEKFDGYPDGVRAIQIPDPQALSAFLKMFGGSERTTACACERSGDVTLPQLLNLQNGDRMRAKIQDANGALAKLLASQKDDAKLTEELFLRTLGRIPKPQEAKAVQTALKSGDTREDIYRDILWALLNSKEFAFNH